MEAWAILAIGTAVLTSFNPILYKRMLKDADPIIVVWGVTLLSTPLLGLFAFSLSPQFPDLDWIFVLGVLGSAGLNSLAHLASMKALKLADVSLVTPLLIFSPVFTVIISAFFLGEIPSVLGLLGIGLVLIGAYWLTRNSETSLGTPFKSLALTPGVVLVLLAGLLWAITPLFEKTAIQHTNPESPRFAAFTITTLLVFALSPAVITKGKLAVRKLMLHRRELILAGLIGGIAPILGYTAYSLGLVGYVTTLFKLSSMMTVIWSFIFLKERGLAQRLPGSVIMIIGVVLITT